VLDERVVEKVFGGQIDQAQISMIEQQRVYQNTFCEERYRVPVDKLVDQISPKDRPLAAIQLANEMLQRQAEQLRNLEHKVLLDDKRRRQLEGELEKVERFRKKMEAKQKRPKKKKSKKARKAGKK
jgi:cell envelope opacity-associated protein A